LTEDRGQRTEDRKDDENFVQTTLKKAFAVLQNSGVTWPLIRAAKIKKG